MADDDPAEQHAANAQSNTAKLDVADLATSGLSANTKADVKLIAPNTTAMVVRISHSGG